MWVLRECQLIVEGQMMTVAPVDPGLTTIATTVTETAAIKQTGPLKCLESK